MLNKFSYGTNPFYNYISLIDTKKHLAEDSLKSEKHLENMEVVQASLGCWTQLPYQDPLWSRHTRRQWFSHKVRHLLAPCVRLLQPQRWLFSQGM